MNLKFRGISLLCFLLSLNLIAQNNFPNGMYLSIDQLKNKTPAYDVNLNVIKRSEGSIGWNGGNDYELQSEIDSLTKKFLKKRVYAYVKNDSLFLNCMQHRLSNWYALALTQGTFIVFNGAMSDKEASGKVATYGVLFGAVGGGIAGASIAKKRFLYALSLRTGNAKRLNKNYLTERLKETPDILKEYLNEKEPDADSTLIKYVKLLNQAIPISNQ